MIVFFFVLVFAFIFFCVWVLMSNQNIGTCGFALFCIIVFIFVAPFLFVSSGLVFVNVSFSSGYLLTFFTHDTRVIWYLWLKMYFMSNFPNIPQGGLPLPFYWLLYTSHEERTQGGRQTVRWKEKYCFSSYPYWFQVSRVTLTWLTSGTWSIRHSKNWRKKLSLRS